jgi:hypothetical protein
MSDIVIAKKTTSEKKDRLICRKVIYSKLKNSLPSKISKNAVDIIKQAITVTITNLLANVDNEMMNKKDKNKILTPNNIRKFIENNPDYKQLSVSTFFYGCPITDSRILSHTSFKSQRKSKKTKKTKKNLNKA